MGAVKLGVWQTSNFRLLFFAQTASAFGNMLLPVALAFGVLGLTGSAIDLGLVLGAGASAQVLSLLAGGVLADRTSRRLIMIVADILRAIAQLALGLVLLLGEPSTLTLIALNAVIGLGSGLFAPASVGLTPAVVRTEQLQEANSLLQISFAAAGVAGPAVAGVLVVAAGPGWAIVGGTATFLISAALLARLRLAEEPHAGSQRWLVELRQGWVEFVNLPWFRNVVVGASVFNCSYAGFIVLGPLVAKENYGGASTWAAILTASAVGAVVAGLATIRARPLHPLRVAVPAIALASIAPLAMAGLLPPIAVAFAAAIGGAGIIIFESVWQTSVQRQVPEKVLSRMSSYDYFGSLIAYPVGLTLAGPLAAAVGARSVLFLVGGLQILLVVTLLFMPSVRGLRDDPEHN